MSKQYRVLNDHQIPLVTPSAGTTDETGRDNYIERLLADLKINILSMTENDIEFDLIGVDASIANALRRIMLAEV